MAVYLIIEITVKNPELYSKYVERVPEVVEKHGGRYLVRGGRVTPVSQTWHPERIIVVEFPGVEDVRRCFASPEYRELAPLREQATVSKAIVVEGCGT